MKSLLVLCALVLSPLLTAPAAVLLDEPFNYPDGALAAVSLGRWVTHGGTSNQVDVSAGRVNLTQAETEDVNALLEGGPFRGSALYAAFTVNVSGLPSGAGAYFAHFKDGSSTGFRGRVYATTNGAAPGRWRAGIASGAGTPAVIATDLQPNTDYPLVLRYDTGTPASTLWIAPVSESTTQDRAEATDAATALSITSFALRQALTAGDGIGTLTIDDLRVGSTFVDVVRNFDPHRDPPVLSALPDQSIPANHSTPAVPFVIDDAETAAGDLLLRAASDNPGLVAVPGVVFGGGGSNRTVVVTPVPGRQGTAHVTVTVTDADGNTADGTFQVTVGVPSLSPLADQVTPMDTPTAPIPFLAEDAEGDVLSLAVSSSNEAVLPSSQIHVGGAGSNRTLTLEPAAGATGLAQVDVTASDGFNSVRRSFVLTVFPTRGVVLREPFDYPDGSLVTNSAFAWVTHSASAGQTGQTQVVRGELLLSASQGEDLHVTLSDAPYAPAGTWVLYARFKVNFSARPGSGGEYFAHFRGANSGAAARVFATTSGAGAGKLRLGVANNSGNPSAILATDLETNTAYTVVTRLNVATGQTTLWVNPGLETDPSATASDSVAPFEIWSYAFRQAAGIGSLSVDDLQVGTRFTDVVDPAARLQIRLVSEETVEVSWPASAGASGYRLQTSPAVGAGWVDSPATPEKDGDRLILRLPLPVAPQFFRLIK